MPVLQRSQACGLNAPAAAFRHGDRDGGRGDDGGGGVGRRRGVLELRLVEQRGVLGQRGQADGALACVRLAAPAPRTAPGAVPARTRARAALQDVLELGAEVLAEDAVQQRVGGRVDVGQGGGQHQEHPAVPERHAGERVEEQQYLQQARDGESATNVRALPYCVVITIE